MQQFGSSCNIRNLLNSHGKLVTFSHLPLALSYMKLEADYKRIAEKAPKWPLVTGFRALENDVVINKKSYAKYKIREEVLTGCPTIISRFYKQVSRSR